jgi:hypothetical protein
MMAHVNGVTALWTFSSLHSLYSRPLAVVAQFLYPYCDTAARHCPVEVAPPLVCFRPRRTSTLGGWNCVLALGTPARWTALELDTAKLSTASNEPSVRTVTTVPHRVSTTSLLPVIWGRVV